jgi:hypothetical protein
MALSGKADHVALRYLLVDPVADPVADPSELEQDLNYDLDQTGRSENSGLADT